MKTPEIIKAIQALQTWRVELDISVHQMQESIGILRAQSDKHGEAIDRLLGQVSVPVSTLQNVTVEGVEGAVTAKFGDGFVIGGQAPILRECKQIDPTRSWKAPVVTTTVSELVPTEATALTPTEASELAESLAIGVADVRAVETAVIKCLAEEMEPAVRKLRALSLHPDVDSITSGELIMFMAKWTELLGLGEKS